MFSPQDIEEKTFEKAFMGGYKAEDVDDFLDGLAVDYKKLYVENAELKKKIGVLVEKIEEYRKDEEYIKNAILYAQKLKEDALKEMSEKTDTYLKEANERAEVIISEASERAREINEETDRIVEITKKTNADLIAKENEALIAIRKEVSDFKTNLQNMYKAHLKIIMSLPTYEEPEKTFVPVQKEEMEAEPLQEETVAEVIEEPKTQAQIQPEEINPARINIALDVMEEPDDEDEEPLKQPTKPFSIDFTSK
jgi:cell division initiation protein